MCVMCYSQYLSTEIRVEEDHRFRQPEDTYSGFMKWDTQAAAVAITQTMTRRRASLAQSMGTLRSSRGSSRSGGNSPQGSDQGQSSPGYGDREGDVFSAAGGHIYDSTVNNIPFAHTYPSSGGRIYQGATPRTPATPTITTA